MNFEIKSISGDLLWSCETVSLQSTVENGANLRDANLNYANLRGANLHCANLRGTNLLCADLRDAKPA
jgi:uncharacterized protein YjbI with pentapeptide repeats